MSWPSVFLIRISSGNFSWTIVAQVARDEEEALKLCNERYQSQSDDETKRYYAKVMSSCSISAVGNSCHFQMTE